MNRLFQPFSQVEMTISRRYGGAGLGLAISKQLAKIMGGTIWAESEAGRGSTFYFTIETEVASDESIKSDNKSRPVENLGEKNPLRILVAEDNPSNQKVLVEMLKRMGYTADAVADGREVLQALEMRPYDLVLMDIRMPEMDGITAAKEIRRRWPNSHTKIIAITAYALAGDRESCLEVGIDNYIAKPVKMEDLARMLRDINPSLRKKELEDNRKAGEDIIKS